MANKAKSSAVLSAEPTINHSRLFPQIHLATSASGSFSEGGQYVVRRRIDCLRGFTMNRAGREDDENGGEKNRGQKQERQQQRELKRESVAQGEREREGGR